MEDRNIKISNITLKEGYKYLAKIEEQKYQFVILAISEDRKSLICLDDCNNFQDMNELLKLSYEDFIHFSFNAHPILRKYRENIYDYHINRSQRDIKLYTCLNFEIKILAEICSIRQNKDHNKISLEVIYFNEFNQDMFAERYIRSYYERPSLGKCDWTLLQKEEKYKLYAINCWIKRINSRGIYIDNMIVTYSLTPSQIYELLIVIAFKSDNPFVFEDIRLPYYDDEFDNGLLNIECPQEVSFVGQEVKKLIINES